MPFTPRLPTFNITCQFFRWTGVAWVIDPFSTPCQLATPKRTCDTPVSLGAGPSPGVAGQAPLRMFLFLPLGTSLADPSLRSPLIRDYVDVTTSQGVMRYWVDEVEPCHAGFPNEYKIAYLSRWRN